jgi:hypothetical protein
MSDRKGPNEAVRDESQEEYNRKRDEAMRKNVLKQQEEGSGQSNLKTAAQKREEAREATEDDSDQVSNNS